MSKKTIIFILSGLLLGGAAFYFLVVKKSPVPSAASWFPKDTMFYGGIRSWKKTNAVMAFADLENTLQTEAGLTEKESRIVGEWVRKVRGVHFGFRSFSLMPFVLDAAVVLDGPFDQSLPDMLGQLFELPIQPDETYREIPVDKLIFPVHPNFTVELYITAPIKDRLIVAFSKRTLTDMIDRLMDGGTSLVDNPQFVEMASSKEIRSADALQYVDVQAYLSLLAEWARTIPYPHFKSVVDLVWSELRLSDYDSSVSGFDFIKQTGCSLLEINPENPLYQQFSSTNRLQLPYIPADASQVSFCRLSDPEKAVGRLIQSVVRLEQGVSRVFGDQVTLPLRHLTEQVCAAVDAHPSELGALLSGDIGFWQCPGDHDLSQPITCFYLGITDADAVRKKIVSAADLEIVEEKGIFSFAGEDALVWRVLPDALLISNERDGVRDVIVENQSSFIETEKFVELKAKLPDTFSILQYVDYTEGIPVQNSSEMPPAFYALIDLFKGFRQLSVSSAQNGMLQSHTAQHFETYDRQFKAVLRLLFSFEKLSAAQQKNPPFDLSADEALAESLELLSSGRQIDAEKLIDRALRSYPNELDVLFAKAVLERSRWDKTTAARYLNKIMRDFANSTEAKAAFLSLELDKELSEKKLQQLIDLSDANRENTYLLWLSAFQCREQGQKDGATSEFKLKMGHLGKERYEKLLTRFAVGPVLLHQTYANILTEYLDDYEKALEHRQRAVAAEAKGWTLQGLANTLKDMGRYKESCVAWAQAVRFDPTDATYWRQWGNTLYEMEEYEEALEKFSKAARYDPQNGYVFYRMGRCFYRLKRYDEMLKYYRKSISLDQTYGMFRLGRCYEYGIGVEKDPTQAIPLYRQAAEKGYSRAQERLAYCLSQGIGIEKDVEKSLYWYGLAAENGNTRAMTKIAFESVRSGDQEQAEIWCRKCLDHGSAGAVMNIGFSYELGRNLPKDERRAFEWYRKAADMNVPEGLFRVGHCYAKGIGVEQDEQMAFDLFHKAIDCGPESWMCYKQMSWYFMNFEDQSLRSPETALVLARQAVAAHEREETLDVLVEALAENEQFAEAIEVQNQLNELRKKRQSDADLPEEWTLRLENLKKRDFEWLQQAAEQGDRQAESRLCLECVKSGNQEQAKKWCRKAAEKGNFAAVMNIGLSYEQGHNLPKDEAAAFEWYQIAADLGVPGGFFRMGRCYAEGISVEEDEQKAVDLFRKAIELEPRSWRIFMQMSRYFMNFEDQSLRSPETALVLARQAVSSREREDTLDVLVEALAENEQFAEAVDVQSRLNELRKKKKPDADLPEKWILRLENLKREAAEIESQKI